MVINEISNALFTSREAAWSSRTVGRKKRIGHFCFFGCCSLCFCGFWYVSLLFRAFMKFFIISKNGYEIITLQEAMESFAFPNIIKMTKVITFLSPFGCQSFSICQSFMKWHLKLHFLTSVNHLKHQTLAFIHRKLEGPSKLKGT